MVQIQLVARLRIDKDRMEAVIHGPLKSINDKLILTIFDPETGFIELENLNADDEKWHSSGDLSKQWLDAAEPPITNYNLLRNHA